MPTHVSALVSAHDLDQYIPDAVAALAWPGTTVGPRVVLGRRVALVATLLPEPHRQRQDRNQRPVLDKFDLEWLLLPEQRHKAPAPAVSLHGVIAPAGHWPTAQALAAPFVAMCPTVVLLPRQLTRQSCAGAFVPTTRRVGVVAADDHGVDVVRDPQRARPQWDRLHHRLVLETLYQLLTMREADQ